MEGMARGKEEHRGACRAERVQIKASMGLLYAGGQMQTEDDWS